MSYFNLTYNPAEPKGLVHTLNQPYRGAQRFALHAPDGDGTLIVHARDEREASEHAWNALFEMVFNPKRVGLLVANPACLFCGGRTERRGRNSSGTRVWRCLNTECRRSFVLHRDFRGGINHPSQSKKPLFARLLLGGMPVREAAERAGVCMDTAANWATQIATLNAEKFAGLQCRCGKPLRHRGICLYRMTPAGMDKLKRARAARGSKAA